MGTGSGDRGDRNREIGRRRSGDRDWEMGTGTGRWGLGDGEMGTGRWDREMGTGSGDWEMGRWELEMVPKKCTPEIRSFRGA